MKKFAVLFAALLQSFLAYSQEAESENGQFLLIPRIDVNAYEVLPHTDGNGTSFDLGDSSFYTLIEGSIGESNFSYSVANHWLSSDPQSLYSNTFRSDDVNWVDWAYVNYAPGAFDFTIGKNMMALGTFEMDEYDFNSYSPLSSMLWNTLPVYQLGASAGWTSPDEASYLEFGLSASPYSEKPFENGLLAYSARYTGEFGSYKAIWSANLMGIDDGCFQKLITAGNQFYLNDTWTLGLDAYAMFTPADFVLGGKNDHMMNWGLIPSVTYDNGGNFSAMFKLMMEDCRAEEGLMFAYPIFENEDNLAFGAVVNWYPLKSGRDLRVHGLVAANGTDGLILGVGATYFLDIKSAFGR